MNNIENGIFNLNDKVINSSGSNSNGSWIKFEDGTMICHATKLITLDITTQEGSLYRGVDTTGLTFPQTFIEAPDLSPSILSGGGTAEFIFLGAVGWGSQITTTSNTGRIDVLGTTRGTNQSFKYSYIAIGKWK